MYTFSRKRGPHMDLYSRGVIVNECHAPYYMYMLYMSCMNIRTHNSQSRDA